MKQYYYAEIGNFWDVFPACIITGRKYYEAFPVISADSWGLKCNFSKQQEYYEKGLKSSLDFSKLIKKSPEYFSILSL